MAGKLNIVVIVLSIVLQSCSGDIAGNLIGDRITRNSGLVQGSNWSGDHFWFHDVVRQRIHKIDVKNFAYMLSLDALPAKNRNTANSLFSPSEADWVVEMTYKDLRVISPDGSILANPFSFQGEPKSVSWDSDTRNLIIYDDLKSVVMSKLTTEGDIAAKAILGSNLDSAAEDSEILTGDLDDQSRLILFMANNQFAVVDFDATISGEKWIYTTFDLPGITQVDWIAPLKTKNNRALLSSNEGLFLIDYVTQNILDQFNFAENSTIIHRSRNFTPHIIYDSGSVKSVVYPSDDKIQSIKTINFSLMYAVGSSVLDTVKDSYAISYATEMNSESIDRVSRYRISDGLFTSDQQMKNHVGQLIVGEKYAVSIFDSYLGHIQRTDLVTSDQEMLSGFNEPWYTK